jgi:phosphatidylserine synthase
MTLRSLDELRAVCQPASTLDRRGGEHWLGRLFLRAVSLRVTAVLVRLPVTANHVTGLMIVVGLVAAVVAALPGLGSAVAAWLLVLAYFVLDLCDGEVARWRRQTSVTGIYLDRVGHYLVEAALLAAYGFRAGGQQFGGWSTLGLAAALFAILIKAETDLVDVARARSGMPAASEASAELRNAPLGRLRRAGHVFRVHTLIGAIESSFLLVVAAVIDHVVGGLTASKVLVGVLAAIAAIMLVVHLVSILASRRLR